MKRFPRIYSLSTLGLRQHQEFDYRFHPFRTDFIGESGSGKSMIADLLQLIFVGSEAFKSATESLDERTPEGMVLKIPQNRGTDLGYSFLNIQLSENEFVVVGAYLESSNRNNQAFVIQSGYAEDKLVPLGRVLSTNDLLIGNKIPTLDELKEHLETHGFVCQAWSQKRKFHDFLFRHRILSIDLTISDKVLKDYASIIQSFSRGKTLEVHKSKSLKSFLFGDENGKEIFKKYKVSVDELQSAVSDYGRNRNEIEKVTAKQKELLELKQIKDKKEFHHKDWLFKAYAFYCYEERQAFESLIEVAKNSISSFNFLQTILNIIKSELSQKDFKITSAKKTIGDLQKQFQTSLELNSRVNTLNSLLVFFNCNEANLKVLFEENKKIVKMKSSYARVKSGMQKEGIWDHFLNLKHHQSTEAIITNLMDLKREESKTLEESKSLLVFWDINNKGSLGYWAIKQQRPFTLEEESVIIHYSGLTTAKPPRPAPQDRYIPNPLALIDELSITEPDDVGFWLQLRGIKEYILFVSEQIFTSDKIENLKVHIQDLSKNIKGNIKIIEEKIASIDKLSQFILNQPDFNLFLNAFNSPIDIDTQITLEKLSFSQEEFDSLITAWPSRSEIQQKFAEIDRIYNLAISDQHNMDVYFHQLAETEIKLTGFLNTGKWNQEAEVILNEITPFMEILEDNSQLSKYIVTQLEAATNKIDYINQKIADHRAKLRTFELPTLWEKWKSAETEKTGIDSSFIQTYRIHPELNLPDIYKYPSTEKQEYQVADELFRARFRQIVDRFLPGDSYKFQTVQDYRELCRNMLPEAFQTPELEENDIIEAIERYLKNINEKNKELNKRKLQKIRNLLAEVSDEVSQRLDVARRINNFLDNKEREITGGHRVRLKREFSKEYPKDWINTFELRLDEENTLFNKNQNISEVLSDAVSLEEKMIAAFYACGGHFGTKPTIEKLLDPNSYIDLSFSMEAADSGMINKGSSGQTYAAIALLCIARLSLIDSDDPTKALPGIRFMPIDEAEGLGSNYDMLYAIAKQFDYQIISMSISPLGKFKENEQFVYMLHKNMEVPEPINYKPFAIFCEADKMKQEYLLF